MHNYDHLTCLLGESSFTELYETSNFTNGTRLNCSRSNWSNSLWLKLIYNTVTHLHVLNTIIPCYSSQAQSYVDGEMKEKAQLMNQLPKTHKHKENGVTSISFYPWPVWHVAWDLAPDQEILLNCDWCWRLVEISMVGERVCCLWTW